MRTQRFANVNLVAKVTTVLTLLFVTGIASTASAQIRFREVLRQPVGLSPLDVLAADLDGDGRLELLTSNRDSSNLTFLWLNGRPRPAQELSLSTSIPAGHEPNLTQTGDFNEDGVLDIVVMNRFDFVQVRLGLGNGAFGPAIDGCATGNSQALAVGDFNGDHHQDVAVASYGKVSVQLGDGTGGFAPCTTGGDWGATADGMVAADFNNDGLDDLAIAEWFFGKLSIRLADGTGDFDRPYRLVTAADRPTDILVRDLDLDGTLDIAMCHGAAAGAVPVFWGPVYGRTQLVLTGGSIANSITAADFDGDGLDDLAVTHRDSENVVVLRQSGIPGPEWFTPAWSRTIPGKPRDVSGADLDQDGRPDLAVTLQDGNEVVLLRNTSP